MNANRRLSAFLSEGSLRLKKRIVQYRLAKSDFDLAQATSLVEQARLASDCPHIAVFVNGYFVDALSKLKNLPTGVTFNAEAKDANALNATFPEGEREHPFVLLNTAFSRSMIEIAVEENVQAEAGLQLIFISLGQERAASYPRVSIRVAKGASFRVVENFISSDDSESFTGFVEEVELAEEASLYQAKIGALAPNATHISKHQLRQARSSHYEGSVLTFGGALVRNELGTVIEGEEAHYDLKGLSLISGKQLVDNHTVIEHAAPNATSNELIKGVYADESTGVFNGTIIVRQIAQQTNAIQSNAGLLLSDKATLNSRPQLKIWADDVKCTHGATIGELDEDALFYLQSRGIPQAKAKHILVTAFLGDVLTELPFPELRERTEQQLFTTLARFA